MSWYQKNGSYPFEEWIDYKTSEIIPNFPWKQKNGEYPHCEWIEYKTSDIHPSAFWFQKNGAYPYRDWIDYKSSEAFPAALWSARDGEMPHKGWNSTEYPKTYPFYAWRGAENIPFKGWNTLEYPKTYPVTTWRGRRGSIPYKQWAEFPSIHAEAVHQPPYICVYDMHHEQESFDNNGMTILTPSKCEITEELNGMYELLLEHPIDSEGRWKNLLELNIIKANNQLFRIYNKQTIMSSDGSRMRVVNARHIFYDLNDKLLLDVRPENKNGMDFLNWIMERIYDDDPEGYYPQYDFEWFSDISRTATSYFIGTSVTAALLGEDNCFVNRLGGEIHRDNFYFSILDRKETSKADAFSIRYGVDMIDIEENIDYSEMITHLIAKDNHSHEWEVYYKETPRLHHNVTRSVKFDYEQSDENAFRHDAEEYFKMYCQPSINYKVTFANLKNVELYKDFIGLQECNIGDTGQIYCEELGIVTTQKIIKKTIDCLSESTVEIELGNLSSSLTRRDKYMGTISIGTSADKAAEAAAEEARKAKCANMRVWRNGLAYNWKDFRDSKWRDIYHKPEEE